MYLFINTFVFNFNQIYFIYHGFVKIRQNCSDNSKSYLDTNTKILFRFKKPFQIQNCRNLERHVEIYNLTLELIDSA